jgi:hypothetical protein
LVEPLAPTQSRAKACIANKTPKSFVDDRRILENLLSEDEGKLNHPDDFEYAKCAVLTGTESSESSNANNGAGMITFFSF